MSYRTVVVLGSFADSLVRFRGHLIASLTQRGHRVVACAPGAGADVVNSLAAMGAEYRDVSLRRAGLNPYWDLATLWSLFRLFRELKPDVVFAYTIKPVVYGSMAGALAGVPRRFALITGLGFAFTDGGGRLRRLTGAIARLMYRAALSRCQGVFLQNPDDLALFRSQRILSDTQAVSLVPGSGIDVDEYPFRPAGRGPNFLMIARLVRDKGVREYVDAARLVKSRFPDARFRLIGWIDENPTAITRADLDAWVAEGVIEYLGHVRDVRPPLCECAAYVLPSYREGTPRTVLEAMAIGRAIVTTDAPGCRETVVDGDNGFLVPVADSAALADALIRLLQDPALIESFGRRSREVAIEKYDVRLISRLLIDKMGL